MRGTNGPAYFPWGEERTSTPDGTDKFATYFRDVTSNGVGEDYANARYYNNNFGRFWSPDPGYVGDAGNPQSLNRYSYVLGDPVNQHDPSGLCTVLIAGSTQSPGSSPAVAQAATAMGADSAYPFSGQSVRQSVGSVIGMSSGDNSANQAAVNAIQYALSSNTGLVDIIAYSGGAAAFTAAYNALTQAQQQRIGLVLYLSPGANGSIANVENTTNVVQGSTLTGGGIDFKDFGAMFGTTLPLGAPLWNSSCAHTDFACLLGVDSGYVNQMKKNGKCNNPEVFTRTSPKGTLGFGIGSTGGGITVGVAPPSSNPPIIIVFVVDPDGIGDVTSVIHYDQN